MMRRPQTAQEQKPQTYQAPKQKTDEGGGTKGGGTKATVKQVHMMVALLYAGWCAILIYNV